MNSTATLPSSLLRVRRWATLTGIAAGLSCAAAGYFAPRQFFPAYLVAFLFWLGISLGSLAIGMLHHVTGGSWGVPIRRIVESAAATFPLMAVLFLPIVLGMPTLYVWSNTDVVAADEILQRKVHYLNDSAFLLRSAIYFTIWILLSLILNRLTATPDVRKQESRQRVLALISSPGLVLWGLSVTFAAVDWSMSIEPHWFSSMYGVLFMAGQAVSGLACSILIVIMLDRLSFSANAIPLNTLTTSRLHDLGNLLLALVMFWSYVSFMQFLIIWGGNLPEEVPWYLHRSRGGWQIAAVVLVGLHFLLPVLLLLMRQMKRNPTRLLRLAVMLLVMRLIDLSWLVLPTFTPSLFTHGAEVSPHTSDHGTEASNVLDLWPLLLTVPAIGGLWLAVVSWRLSVRALLPVEEIQSAQERHHELAGHTI